MTYEEALFGVTRDDRPGRGVSVMLGQGLIVAVIGGVLVSGKDVPSPSMHFPESAECITLGIRGQGSDPRATS